MNLRFEFGCYLNLNLLRGSGSGILPNLIPEPQVRNQVQTGFGRFRNQTAASLLATGAIVGAGVRVSSRARERDAVPCSMNWAALWLCSKVYGSSGKWSGNLS